VVGQRDNHDNNFSARFDINKLISAETNKVKLLFQMIRSFFIMIPKIRKRKIR